MVNIITSSHSCTPFAARTVPCTKCVPSKDGPTCCGKGGSWVGKCGPVGDPQFIYSWAEGLEKCSPSTTPSMTRKMRVTHETGEYVCLLQIHMHMFIRRAPTTTLSLPFLLLRLCQLRSKQRRPHLLWQRRIVGRKVRTCWGPKF